MCVCNVMMTALTRPALQCVAGRDRGMTDEQISGAFQQMDENADGNISREEFMKCAREHGSPFRTTSQEDQNAKQAEEIQRLNSHIFLDTRSGLLRSIMRQQDPQRQLRELLQRGHVPSSLVAMHIVLECSDISKNKVWINRGMMYNLTVSLALTFLGAIVRAAHGQAPFGSTAIVKLFYAARVLPEFFFGFGLLWFAVAPCFWYYRQILMAQRLLDLIAAPQVPELRWDSRAKAPATESMAALPRPDLSVPSNIEGWASIRRVLFGRNFAPAIEFKFQFYVSITLSLFLFSAAANAFGKTDGQVSSLNLDV